MGTRVASHDDQIQAERIQREAAIGKRAKAVLKGDLGPVLRRWVSASIVPVAGRVRAYHEALNEGRGSDAGAILHSPLFGMPSHAPSSKHLEAILEWFSKPGEGEDLVLAIMGTTVTALARAGQTKPIPLTRVLFSAGQAARETAMGQFVTQIQGAKAMLKVRRNDRASWAQHKKLDGIAAMLGSQVRYQEMVDKEGEEIPLGGKAVLSIITPKGDERMISLRRPSQADWDLLDVARNPEGTGDPHAGTWASFTMLVLVAAQAEAGWFDIASIGADPNKKRRGHKGATGLILSPGAYEAIKGDLDKWLRLGFTAEPMVVEPVAGDYISVKHRAVAGGRGPMGIKTQAKDSAAWYAASEVMAKTPWNVHAPLLKALHESEFVRSLAAKDVEDDVRRETILNGYRKFAPGQDIYFPLYMDFRGRVYTRPSDVTYQGKDLQKALLVFPNDFSKQPLEENHWAVVSHTAALYGGPDKLDKAAFKDRFEWYAWEISEATEAAVKGDWDNPHLQDLLQGADEPLQLLTALTLHAPGQLDRIPIDADGTCNGLQHLSALFRDEEAAPFVNLVGGTDRPADIYAEVARRVVGRLAQQTAPWAARLRAAVKIDRKLCKTPVMVLPYGGTRGTIEEAVLEAILAQEPHPAPWKSGWICTRDGAILDDVLASDWTAGNYAAFRERELKDHPLLHSDAKKLGGLVWDCITEVIPKAMAAMQTFRDIAKTVGDRTLEWDTQYSTATHDSLWVIQAKAKSERSTLKFKGLHLPASVRGLSIRSGRDDVDAASHTSGIVANRIHSLDATHLARTMGLFGMPCFGAIHDSFRTRPSQRDFLDLCTRRAFRAMYLLDPLAGAVMMYEPGEKKGKAYGSWYELAKECDTEFPEDGEWDPGEVMHSKWFFS